MKAVLIFIFLILVCVLARRYYVRFCYGQRLKKILTNNEYVHVKPSEMILLRRSGVPVKLYTGDLHFWDAAYGPIYFFEREERIGKKTFEGFAYWDCYQKIFLNWSLSEALEFKSLLEEEERKEQEQKYESNESKEAYAYLIRTLSAYANREQTSANEKVEEAQRLYEEVQNNGTTHPFY